MLNQKNQKLFPVEDQIQSLVQSFEGNHKFCEAVIKDPNVLVIVQDRLGGIIYFNQACEFIVGSSLDEVKGKCIWDLCMVPEQVEMSQAIFQEVLTGKYPIENKNYLVGKNGNFYLISWLNAALTDRSNCVEYVVSVGFHVIPDLPTLDTGQSEWKIEKKFRAFFDESSDFMALLQPDGQFIEANQTLLDYANLTLADIAGKYLWEMDWWTIGNKTQAQKDIVLQTLKGESVRCEIKLRGKDESARTIDFSLKPFRDEIGKVTMLRLEGRDITEKKQLEAQVFHLQRLESLGMLASGIAHDINNILTPVLAIADLLKYGFPDADVETHNLLNILKTNAKNVAKLVKQILSFSRGVEEKRTVIQVGQLISEVKDFALSSFPKSILIDTHIPTNSGLISGDFTQLHQVLMNLCINARDAMPEGGTLSISVGNLFLDESYVRICPDVKAGAYIEITVMDMGNGIHPEIVDQIFDPFFTTKELNGGTGLGLSTVKTIVENHSGFINLYSKPGEGTVFKIYLPALQQEAYIQPSGETFPAGNGELIMIIDDEPTICNVTKTTLENYGYQALTASDGFEAIALYAQYKNQINAVLMDITMPLTDSENAIHVLRKMNPEIKTIALSGFNCVSQRIVAIENGVQAFLSKPYTTEKLLQTINQVLYNPVNKK